ncbi:sigma-70 family RNA polymerase sigma factor, partial [Microbacterium sp.]|uniref:sigma-70 family RNA polymerase sigma factor n=1 Tax=Microbacterium sp. TaxID=51671 RepID=UPI003A8A7733
MDPDDTADVNDVSDADLVQRTRAGEAGAFGQLWQRHYRAGITVARSVTSSLDPDDLVQEAYARIFSAIQKGGGPTGAFRAYLFTSIRNTAAGWGRAKRESAMDELETVPDPEAVAHTTDEALDRSLTNRAFRSLPTRWQEILWYTEIEQMKPAEIAPLLGMKPTAVAQLAFRAREGLREAWIQAHLRNAEPGSECQWTIEHLGAYARNNLGRRDHTRATDHLSQCARCTIVASEATEVSHRLSLIVLPLAVGAGVATAYLASAQGGGTPLVALAAAGAPAMPGAVV